MRTFNYTGRKKLNRDEVKLTLFATEQGREFESHIELQLLKRRRGIEASSRLIIEASNGTKFARFDHGTVGAPKFGVRHSLAKFGANENVNFRAKVVGPSGRLLALAEHIQPQEHAIEPKTTTSLLPVSVEPLDDLVYRVAFDMDGSAPRLVLNESLDASLPQGIKSYARTPIFVALVLPNVVREILTRILLVDRHNAAEGESTGAVWADKWLRFASRLTNEPLPSDADEDVLAQWIDVATAGVGRHLDAVRRFEQEVSVAR